MVRCKLYYFPVRNLAEVARQLMVLADVDFDDIRIPFEEWPARKNDFPMQQLPVMEVNGVQIPQSFAIARYIARQHGYAGKTPEEEAIVDALGDCYKDFYSDIKTWFYTAMGFLQGDAEELKKKDLIPARNRFYVLMTEYLKKSKTGFLAGDDLTWIDLVLADAVITHKNLVPDIAEYYPEITAHQNKVHSIPKLKNWLDTRPVTRS